VAYPPSQLIFGRYTLSCTTMFETDRPPPPYGARMESFFSQVMFATANAKTIQDIGIRGKDAIRLTMADMSSDYSSARGYRRPFNLLIRSA
jgi:hypothetical protein